MLDLTRATVPKHGLISITIITQSPEISFFFLPGVAPVLLAVIFIFHINTWQFIPKSLGYGLRRRLAPTALLCDKLYPEYSYSVADKYNGICVYVSIQMLTHTT